MCRLINLADPHDRHADAILCELAHWYSSEYPVNRRGIRAALDWIGGGPQPPVVFGLVDCDGTPLAPPMPVKRWHLLCCIDATDWVDVDGRLLCPEVAIHA